VRTRVISSPSTDDTQTQGKTTETTNWIPAAVAFAIACAAALLLPRATAPFAWGALSLAVACMGAERSTRRTWGRALWINLAVLCFTFAAAETYFWAHEPIERQMQYGEGFFLYDETLGYKPAAGQVLSHQTNVRDELLYQVEYTINQDGLRAAMPADAAQGEGETCLVFFGDSFTFGEGMPDHQTMPAQVWKKLHGTLRVVNFGFLGYGPHQMLSALQDGRLESQGRCHPTHVVYQAIPSHVSRAAGLESWDPNGPRYVLDDRGRVRRSGRFAEAPAQSALDWYRIGHQHVPWRIRKSLEQSALHRRILHAHRPVGQHDVALFTGIVVEAKTLVDRSYPGARFHVLYWDFKDDLPIVGEVLQQLREHNVTVHPVSTILPNFPADEPRYEISPYDRHPNAMAHEMIADFVAGSLLQQIY